MLVSLRLRWIAFAGLAWLAAPASSYELLPLEEMDQPETTLRGRAPILGDDGRAYWKSREANAEVLKADPGGPLGSVEDLPPASAGDAPLFNGPTDAAGSSVLLNGKLFVPAPVGFYQTNAYYAFPGFGRFFDYTSPVATFPNDPVFTVPEFPPLFDADGSIVFLHRDGTNQFDLRFAICRLSGGSAAILVETDVTVVPGGNGGAFSRLGPIAVSGGVILFYGDGGGRHGVYQLSGAGLQVVVDDQTVLPPNASPVLLLDPGDVVFANEGANVAIGLREINGGVWKRIGGTWSRVAARSDAMPGGTGIFYDFIGVAIRDGIAAFVSRRVNQFLPPRDVGVYTDLGGAPQEVANLVDDFPDVVAAAEITVAPSGRWFDGEDLVFEVATDQFRGVYRAVPEPGAWIAAAGAIAALGLLRRQPRADCQRRASAGTSTTNVPVSREE